MNRSRSRTPRRVQRGASLVEYVMGVGFVVIVAIGGMTYFGERVNDSVANSGDEIVAASDETPTCQSAAAAGDPVGLMVPADGAPFGVTMAGGSEAPCDIGELAVPPHEAMLDLCPEAGPGDDFMVVVTEGGELLAYGSLSTQTWAACSVPEGSSEI